MPIKMRIFKSDGNWIVQFPSGLQWIFKSWEMAVKATIEVAIA